MSLSLLLKYRTFQKSVNNKNKTFCFETLLLIELLTLYGTARGLKFLLSFEFTVQVQVEKKTFF